MLRDPGEILRHLAESLDVERTLDACSGATREDINYMYHWLENEGNLGLLSHIKKQGIDPLKHVIEFGTYEFGMKGGLASSPASETNIDGLYCSGDEYGVMSGMAPAVIWGWIAGENMAKRAREIDLDGIQSLEPQIEEETNKLNSILNRTSGASWQEVNVALQTTMVDYAGGLRSEALLDQGPETLSHAPLRPPGLMGELLDRRIGAAFDGSQELRLLFRRSLR